MFTKLLTLSVLFVSALCLSIGTVSEQNVTKRETNPADLFPDWVPFKNKHGDELGEFVQVPKKSKVKKRLALPFNFLIRAVAEPEGDDYYEKAAGESDNEDYFEKREWSDLQRPAKKTDNKVKVDHSDISDIDGVVEIIKKPPSGVILDAINHPRSFSKQNIITKTAKKKEIDYSDNEDTDFPPLIVKIRENEEKVKNHSEEENKDDQEETSEKPKNKSEEEQVNDGNEGTSKKPKERNPEEDLENEKRKAKILSSVDELKERHAEEQRELSERVRGEDLYRHEFGKDTTIKDIPERFSSKSSEENVQKQRVRKPTTKPDYDEYEDFNSLEDKYKIHVLKNETPAPTEIPRKLVTTTETVKKVTRLETGRLSVFKNPQLYIIDDDDSTTKASIPMKTRGQQKFSSRYTSEAPNSSDDRISLVPVKSKDGEPTLFFPKSRKNRRKKVRTTTQAAIDSFVAETVTDNYKQTSGIDVTGTASEVQDTTAPSGSDITAPSTRDSTASNVRYKTSPSAFDHTAPSSGDNTASDTVNDATRTGTAFDTTGTDALSANTDTVTDAIPASSDHKKEKNEDYHNEKGNKDAGNEFHSFAVRIKNVEAKRFERTGGGGREHTSEHSEEHEEHGKKAYEGHHEDTKTAEGHHDKENHLGKYDDHGGVDKHHSEESGHYGGHHHEEHGKKHAEYEESGKHSKGHSTKGSHDVHKKEEYEKKVEFFEEDGDSGEDEMHGGYNHEKEHSAGGRFKKGNLKAGHQHHSKGESGHFDKGGHHYINKGHKQATGHDNHGKKEEKHLQKEGKAGGRKWVYHHGIPAKNSNLVVIDRRGDQYFHGPHYYG